MAEQATIRQMWPGGPLRHFSQQESSTCRESLQQRRLRWRLCVRSLLSRLPWRLPHADGLDVCSVPYKRAARP